MAETCQHPDTVFSRSVCALDGWMHTNCSACGIALDGDCGQWYVWVDALPPGELSRMVHAQPGYAEDHARAEAELAAGKGMTLTELRRFLGLDEAVKR